MTSETNNRPSKVELVQLVNQVLLFIKQIHLSVLFL